MKIPFADPTFVRAVVSGIIDAVGRPVTLTYETGLQICTVCSGTDPFCITCSGNKYLQTTSTLTRQANIKWNTLDSHIYRPEGQYYDGVGYITLLYDTTMADILKKTIDIFADNRHFVVKNIYLNGVNTDRVIITLEENEKYTGYS